MVSNVTPHANLKALQIIVSALLFGVVSFATVAVVLTRQRGALGGSEASSQAQLLLPVLGLFGLGLLSAYPLVRRFKIRQLRESWHGDVDPRTNPSFFVAFQTLTIVGAAMAEGFCLFSLVVFLVTASPLALAACAIGLVPLISFFPTAARMESFAATAREQ